MGSEQRLNGIIRELEAGRHAFMAFVHPNIQSAVEMGDSSYTGALIDMEHNLGNPTDLPLYLQFMLNRAQIVGSGSIAPKVTPIVRVPVNGVEMAQSQAKQALDVGAYGIMFPHISTEAQAYNAVATCRYPTLQANPIHEPAGIRGDGPKGAVRYWGLPAKEYYKRADVWPLNPKGEILAILQIEDLQSIGNLETILKKVPGIGAIVIGEGDLGQELGDPRNYANAELLRHMSDIVRICKENRIPVGHPHVEAGNAQRVIEEGYSLLFCAPKTSYSNLDAARKASGLK